MCCMVNMVKQSCSTVQIKVRVGPCTATWVQLFHYTWKWWCMVVHGAVWCNASFAINGFLKRFLSFSFCSDEFENTRVFECFSMVSCFCLNSAILPIGASWEGWKEALQCQLAEKALDFTRFHRSSLEHVRLVCCVEGPNAGVGSLQLAAEGPEPGWSTEEGVPWYAVVFCVAVTGCSIWRLLHSINGGIVHGTQDAGWFWMVLDDSCIDLWMSPALFSPPVLVCPRFSVFNQPDSFEAPEQRVLRK